MPRSTLTAVVCNYNHGKLIGRALEALLSQSRPPDELIVVDDGSTDDSAAIIQSWADRHSTIRFLRNERNLGLHASAMKALYAATGDLLYQGSADDRVLPGFFEAVCDLMDRYPQAGVGCSQFVTALAEGTRVRTEGYAHVAEPRFFPPEEFRRDCLDPLPPTHSLSASTIYRRQRVLEIGGWRPELGSWYDTFAIRALGLKYGLCYVPMEGAVWFVMPQGLSQSNLRDPLRSLHIVRTAAALMRSAEFRGVFPTDHVDAWEEASVEAIVLQQLQPAIDGYQAVQQVSRDAGRQAAQPWRYLLALFRKLTTACYLAQHHLQRRILRQRLLAVERAQRRTAADLRGPE
jgi:cellulose synthase/poly-beta-1,6-N-acetylglucosamine synthase-like glycosyltransferase